MTTDPCTKDDPDVPRELHVNDSCPECGNGIMLGVDLIGDRHALVLECDRCLFRHAIPPGPISGAEAQRWQTEDEVR